MNYYERVLRVVKNTHLDGILDLIPNDNKEIYFIGGISRAIILDECYSKDVDIVVPDFDENLVENLSKKFEINYFPSYKSIAIKTEEFEYQINSFRKDIHSTGRHLQGCFNAKLKRGFRKKRFHFNCIYINLLGVEVYEVMTTS